MIVHPQSKALMIQTIHIHTSVVDNNQMYFACVENRQAASLLHKARITVVVT